MTAAAVVVMALLLDRLLGEPRRLHPLVGFGQAAAAVERRWNRAPGGVTAGGMALVLLVLPPVLLVAALWWLPVAWRLPLEAFGLYLAVGLRSLAQHAEAVAVPLTGGDLAAARDAVGAMVSRDAAQLDGAGIAAAASESVLENGSDAVIASLFWFLLLGLPGVVLHRLVNTLDAMWGYRNARYARFGRIAARLDDVLNWLPARVTALAYALAGRTRAALHCWRRQSATWDSPNAGPVMAAGAGALGVRLGGPAPYAGGWKDRPVLGEGGVADAATVRAAVRLVQRAAWGFALGLLLLALLVEGLSWVR